MDKKRTSDTIKVMRNNIEIQYAMSKKQLKHMQELEDSINSRMNPDSLPLNELAESKTLKMYILVKDSIDLGHAMLAVGHGVLSCYLRFADDEFMQKWVECSFRKCVCKVNDKEFENAKQFTGSVLMTESGLDGAETALVFCPRPVDKWDKPFTWYKLYK